MYEEQSKICWRLEKACTDLLTQTGRIVKENEEMRRKMLDLEENGTNDTKWNGRKWGNATHNVRP